MGGRLPHQHLAEGEEATGLMGRPRYADNHTTHKEALSTTNKNNYQAQRPRVQHLRDHGLNTRKYFLVLICYEPSMTLGLSTSMASLTSHNGPKRLYLQR